MRKVFLVNIRVCLPHESRDGILFVVYPSFACRHKGVLGNQVDEIKKVQKTELHLIFLGLIPPSGLCPATFAVVLKG